MLTLSMHDPFFRLETYSLNCSRIPVSSACKVESVCMAIRVFAYEHNGDFILSLVYTQEKSKFNGGTLYLKEKRYKR